MSDTPLARRAVSIVGPAGPVTTAFLCGLARELGAAGLQVAVLSREISSPLPDEEKDTGRYRRAGACLAALAAPGWLLLTYPLPDIRSRPALAQILELLAPWADGVLVEGEGEGLPRILLAPEGGPATPEAGAVVAGFSPQMPVPAVEVARVAALIRKWWEAA
ncbi:MAG: molybdopterin-guanine dinucleotide biosynthesis protein MobB [Syntrophobacterales bacterium]|nr:molybdopterin-guanine dinucleotide biosynthesis protein MobB [Syntrophobacterales bacterium]